MGSSCKSIKVVQELNDFETPASEGQIRRVGNEPTFNKQYCSNNHEEALQLPEEENQLTINGREQQINQILLNSIKYQRMIYKFEAVNQRISKRQKKKQKKNFINTGHHSADKIYQNLRNCILTPELSSTEIRMENSTYS